LFNSTCFPHLPSLPNLSAAREKEVHPWHLLGTSGKNEEKKKHQAPEHLALGLASALLPQRQIDSPRTNHYQIQDQSLHEEAKKTIAVYLPASSRLQQ
jgi:hypothetical protein